MSLPITYTCSEEVKEKFEKYLKGRVSKWKNIVMDEEHEIGLFIEEVTLKHNEKPKMESLSCNKSIFIGSFKANLRKINNDKKIQILDNYYYGFLVKDALRILTKPKDRYIEVWLLGKDSENADKLLALGNVNGLIVIAPIVYEGYAPKYEVIDYGKIFTPVGFRERQKDVEAEIKIPMEVIEKWMRELDITI